MIFELPQVPLEVWIQLTFPASGSYHDRTVYSINKCTLTVGRKQNNSVKVCGLDLSELNKGSV